MMIVKFLFICILGSISWAGSVLSKKTDKYKNIRNAIKAQQEIYNRIENIAEIDAEIYSKIGNFIAEFDEVLKNPPEDSNRSYVPSVDSLILSLKDKNDEIINFFEQLEIRHESNFYKSIDPIKTNFKYYIYNQINYIMELEQREEKEKIRERDMVYR